jgi:hypothetical protein
MNWKIIATFESVSLNNVNLIINLHGNHVVNYLWHLREIYFVFIMLMLNFMLLLCNKARHNDLKEPEVWTSTIIRAWENKKSINQLFVCLATGQ